MRTRNSRFLILSAAGLLGLLLLMSVLAVQVLPTPGGASPPPKKPPPASCNRTNVVKGVLISSGFQPNEFVIGVQHINLSLPAALQHGTGSFSAPLTTSRALVTFIGSGDPAAEKLLATTVSQSGGTRAEALDPNNWVVFQLLIPSNWEGNTLFRDGQVVAAGTRQSESGDLGWVFINPRDCKTNANVVRVALVRLGCGNPQTKFPVPQRPVGPTPQAKPRCPVVNGIQTVLEEGRCVKPRSDDGHGGNQSRQSQPVSEHMQPTPYRNHPPPPSNRPPGDPNGGSGDGGAGKPSGPPDTGHGGDRTDKTTPVCNPDTGANC